MNIGKAYIINISLAIILVLVNFFAFSQSKQGDNWYFGNHAGVKFVNGTAQGVSGGATNSTNNLEGTATISDSLGNLLFYTDGQTVWNKNHQVMESGLLGHASATQSGVIVKWPNSKDSFLIFTIDATQNNLNNGLRYSLVNMQLNSGLGDVVASKKNVILTPSGVKMAEKITAVRHCNNTDIWVIAHDFKIGSSTAGNKFYAFLITPSGVNTTPVVTTIGTVHQGGDNWGYGSSRGYMKATPDGRRIALAIGYDGCGSVGNATSCPDSSGAFEIYDFNYTTGAVSNPIRLKNKYKGAYGIEFSPGGDILYGTTWGVYSGGAGYTEYNRIYQWNLNAGSQTAIRNSEKIIANESSGGGGGNYGAAQLASNQKIYIVRDNRNYLSVINYPNKLGTSCNYQTSGVTLTTGTSGAMGLPTFVQSYFNPSLGFTYVGNFEDMITNFLIADSARIDSVKWFFDDTCAGQNNYSTLFNPSYTYCDTGDYKVTLIIYKCNIIDTIHHTVVIHPRPKAKFTTDTIQCFKNHQFVFTNTSTITKGTIDWHHWDFGDGDTSDLKNPTHVYSKPGKYTVKLIEISDYGGYDSTTMLVYIKHSPKAEFYVDEYSKCYKDHSFLLDNTSSIGSTSTLMYKWYFGNGDSSTKFSPDPYTYLTVDSFSVKLIVKSDSNCSDTAINKIYVRPMPVAGFYVNDSTQCLSGNLFGFTDTSSVKYGTISWKWYFGDNDSSTIKNPQHTYLNHDTFTTKLIVTSNYNCRDTIEHKNVVFPMPDAQFSVNDSTQCLRFNSFSFTNNTSISTGTLNYLWYFGNGDTSTLKNPVYQYNDHDTLQVKLYATSEQGCKDSSFHIVHIYPMPVSQFSINDTSQCLTGNNFIFTSSSTIDWGSLSYKWLFGDTNIATTTNASHSYALADTFAVSLISYSALQCFDTITKNVYVHPMPVAAFSTNDTTQCLKANIFYFTNNSTIASGSKFYYLTFGDGDTSTQKDPNHTYATDDTFTVKLIVTSDFGCKDSIAHTMYVQPMPVADFSILNNGQCLTGNNLSFTNLSTLKWGSFNSYWFFGDNQTSTSTHTNHIYSTDDSFDVKLKIISSMGCVDSVIKQAIVFPVPQFNVSVNDSTQCLNGNNFAFTNNSSVNTGTISFLWVFGDGDTSYSRHVSHTYSIDDTFNVYLIAGTNKGCRDTLQLKSYVFPNPVSLFNVNDTSQCFNENNFVFTNSSTINTGSQTYNWYFGDGATSTLANPTRKYTYDDTFQVKLVNTSNLGCQDSLTKTIYVFPSPETSFSINDSIQCFNENSFIITNNSTINSGHYNDYWNFGDGNTSTNHHVTHAYITDDTFTVKLLLISDLGCKDSLIKNAYVFPNPEVFFSINDTAQCFNENNFVFTNSSTINTGSQTYNWYFGDGATSTLANPTRKYTYDDTFQVKLVNTSNLGCQDSLTKTIYVFPSPETSFSINDSNQCLNGNNFSFTNSSTINSGHFTNDWYFGDGATAISFHANHSYLTDDTFFVKLLLISGLGCSDSLTKKVYIFPNPLAKFSINDTTQCLKNNLFQFTNLTTINSGSTTYFWKFDDGQSATATSPSHSYSYHDTFTVKLITNSNLACSDSTYKKVYVYPMPKSIFTINDSTQCLRGNSFSFTNQSTIDWGNMSYKWYSGDGNSSSNVHFLHAYSIDDTLSVSLVATSDFGCKDSAVHYSIVYPMPVAQYSVNDSTQCFGGNKFDFTNLSSLKWGTYNNYWDFQDGYNTTSANPSHSYSYVDTFPVLLKVTSSVGCNDTVIHWQQTYYMPKSSFDISDSAQCFKGNLYHLTNHTSITAGTLSYRWSLGDGQNAQNQDTQYSYLNPGTYIVKLISTSEKGCKDSMQKVVIVDPMPVAKYAIYDSSQCFEGNAFGFTNLSTIAWGSMTYMWNFGDSATSALTNPVHSYKSADTFLVTLVATSDKGCIDSISKVTYVHVHPEPVAKFSINDSTQCLRDNFFSFINNATIASGYFNSYWDFGNGVKQNTLNASHSYMSHDTFDVKLLVISDWGCKDSIISKAIVYPMPVAKFTINDSSQCLLNNYYEFVDRSTIDWGSLSRTWNSGEPAFSTNDTFIVSYYTHDTFDVQLISNSQMGCYDTLVKKVFVHPMPQAGFLINSSEQCLKDNQFVFTDTSKIHSGTFTDFWSFGDGATSVLKNPAHSYSTYDTLNVKLIVSSTLNCRDTADKMVVIHPMPLAAFNINDSNQCLNGNKYVFTNNTSIPYGMLQFWWFFGDSATDNMTNTEHIYNIEDTNDVKLVVYSQNGCKDSIIKKVYIFPNPVTDFSINDSVQCFKANNFLFTNQTSISSGSMSYLWNFGDGNSSVSTNPAYSYSTDDTFNVRLIATSALACKDTIVKTAYIFPTPVPSFSIDNNRQCVVGNKFSFNNTSTINTGFMTDLWLFGDGDTSVNHSTNHSYLSDDTFNVKLIVTSDLLCSDSIQKTLYVYPNPVAEFSVNDSQQCFNTNHFVFTNNTHINSGSSTYSWNFGDGNSSILTNPNYTYTLHDTFLVELIATSNLSCKDTIYHPVYIFPSPKSSFSINNDKQCLRDNLFVFTNNSTIANGNISSLWLLGDGSTSLQDNPQYQYHTHNIYNVKLVMESTLGCKDSVVKAVEVFPMPVAAFSVNDSSQCLKGNSFNFLQNTAIPYGTLSYNWDFGDGATSSANSPAHTYGTYDTFLVRMIAVSGNNCKDTTYHSSIVYPMPVAQWFVNDSSQCLRGNLFDFSNYSSIPYGTITYLWEFGDSSFSSTKNTNHKYSSFGTFNAKLNVVSANNCYDSLIKPVYVRPMPSATFTVNDSTQCLTNNSFAFNNTSTVASGSLSFSWNFGDGNTSVQGSPTHTYSTYNSYLVRLIALSQTYNCPDTVYHTMEVYPMPKADFIFTVPCLGEAVYFTDQSNVVSPDFISSWLWSFKDGNYSTLQNPDHVFNNSGNFMVKLLAGTNHQCFDSIEKQVKVYPYVEPTIIDRATVVDDKVVLVEWTPINVGRPKQFYLEKSTDKINYSALTTLSPTIFSFNDDLTNVDNNSYTYRIKVLDSCNYYSPYSNIGKTILLKADTNQELPILYWTNYEYWNAGIENYILEAYNQKTNLWETLTNTFPGDTSFEDTNTILNQAQYCYRVVAIRNGDKRQSVSNELCLPTPLRAFIPNAFSPNGDGLNDYFEIKGMYIIEFHIVIYDRWGNKMFESNDLSNQWDGRYNGEYVPTDNYYFHVSIRGTQTQRKFYTGSIMVIR